MYTCQYKPYYTKEIKDEISGETILVCHDCNYGTLDEDQTELTRVAIPQHSGPGLKRRKINHLTVPPPDMIEDPVMLQTDSGTTARPQTGQEDGNNSSSLSNTDVDDEPSSLDLEMLQSESFTYANMSDIQPPRLAIELEMAAISQQSDRGPSRNHRMATADGPPAVAARSLNSRDIQPPRLAIQTILEQPGRVLDEIERDCALGLLHWFGLPSGLPKSLKVLSKSGKTN